MKIVVDFFGKDRPVQQITTPVVQEFLGWLRAHGGRRHKDSKTGKMVGAGCSDQTENQPSIPSDSFTTQAGQFRSISGHSNELQNAEDGESGQESDTSGHKPDPSGHSERVPGEYQTPGNLAEVVAAWPDLSPEQKAQILTIIRGRIA